MLDPDPDSMNLDPQLWWLVTHVTIGLARQVEGSSTPHCQNFFGVFLCLHILMQSMQEERC
jgi:hypothetical protein